MIRENDNRIIYFDKLLLLRLSIDDEEARARKRDLIDKPLLSVCSLPIDDDGCCTISRIFWKLSHVTLQLNKVGFIGNKLGLYLTAIAVPIKKIAIL